MCTVQLCCDHGIPLKDLITKTFTVNEYPETEGGKMTGIVPIKNSS